MSESKLRALKGIGDALHERGAPLTPLSVSERAEREFYFMACGEITILPPSPEGEQAMPVSLRQNAVVTSKDGRIGIAQLARTQQMLQVQLHNKLQANELMNVVDVVILNMIPLGFFSAEEFNKLPEGMKIQERKSENI